MPVMELSQERGNKAETKDTSKTQEELEIPQSFTPFINSGEELLQWLNKNHFRSQSPPPSGKDFEETRGEDDRRAVALLNRKKLETGRFSSPGDKKHQNGVTFLEPLTEEEVEIGQEIRPKESIFQRQVRWSSWEITTEAIVDRTQGANHLTRKSKSADVKPKHEKQSITPKLSPTDPNSTKYLYKGRSTDNKEEKVQIRKPARERNERDNYVSTGTGKEQPLVDRAQKTVSVSHRGSNNAMKHFGRPSDQENQTQVLTRKQKTPSVGKNPLLAGRVLENLASEVNEELSTEDCRKWNDSQESHVDNEIMIEKVRAKRKLSSSISPNPNLLIESRDINESQDIEIRHIQSSSIRRRSYSDSTLLQAEKEQSSLKPKGILKHKRLSLTSSDVESNLNLPKLTPNLIQEESAYSQTFGKSLKDEVNISEAIKFEGLVTSPQISHSLKPSEENDSRKFLPTDLQDRVKSFLEKPIPRNGELPVIKSDKLHRKIKNEQNVEKLAKVSRKYDTINFHTCQNLDIQNMSKIFYHKKEGRCRYLRVPQSPTPPVEWVFEH